MRVLAAFVAMAVAAAPSAAPHTVTLRIDAVQPNQVAKVEVKAPVAGLHLGNINVTATNQISVNSPVSIVVDANVDALTVDAQNGMSVRVSFEQGGTDRELALRIAGSHMILRRNADGDLVLGARMNSAARP